MAKRLLNVVPLIAVFLLISSCRVRVEPKISVTDILSTDSSAIPAFIRVDSENCSQESNRKFFIGITAEYNGCKRSANGYEKEWKVEIPLIKPDDISSIRNTPFAIVRGGSDTLILYASKDALTSVRKKLFDFGSNTMSLLIRLEILNDTTLSITLATSSVWLNDKIAVGQQLSAYSVPSRNYVTVTLSDTSTNAFLREGYESVLIMPFTTEEETLVIK